MNKLWKAPEGVQGLPWRRIHAQGPLLWIVENVYLCL